MLPSLCDYRYVHQVCSIVTLNSSPTASVRSSMLLSHTPLCVSAPEFLTVKYPGLDEGVMDCESLCLRQYYQQQGQLETFEGESIVHGRLYPLL